MFKHDFKLENYLLKLSTKNARILCKFRTGNVKLPIETGRWFNIERDNRMCHLCNSDATIFRTKASRPRCVQGRARYTMAERCTTPAVTSPTTLAGRSSACTAQLAWCRPSGIRDLITAKR